MSKPKIVFVTPVFGQVQNGPALYANILWQAFRDDVELDFHMVVPEDSVSKSELSDPRVHTFKSSARSREFYRSMQHAAIDVLERPEGAGAILHGNISHAMTEVLPRAHASVLQVNDYDAARAYSDWFRIFRLSGPRRALSLAWRHQQEQQAFRQTDHLVFNSHFLCNEVSARYRIPSSVERHTIHKAVDVEFFSEPRPRSALLQAGSGRNIVFVGGNWLRKGLDLAIRSLKALPPEFDDCRLLVAGEPPLGKEKVTGLVKKLGLEHRSNTTGISFSGN